MSFFLNIFRKKHIRPFWPTASLSKFCHFSCALKANRIYLLKSVSCNSALLSNPVHCLTSKYFWTIIIIYNSAGLWIAVPLSSFFQLALLGAGHKTAGLFQALLWFRGAGWACGLFFFLMGNESDMCLSQHLELVSHWFLLFPFILRTNCKLYETGG